MLHFILFAIIFLAASFGSSWLMVKWEYPLPRKLSTREDVMLLVYKLTLFSLIVVVLLAVFLLLGFDLLNLNASASESLDP
jgi:hypothetical protein